MRALTLFGSLFLVTAILTWMVMTRARRVGMLDIPNDRSSHVAPTPRGGGLAIVVAVSLAAAAAIILGWWPARITLFIVAAGLLVAAIGYLDDARGVDALPRAVVHFLAAIPAVVVLGGLPEISVGSVVITPGIWGVAIAAIAVVWFLNLFNFMDGIDGIAASEAIFMTAGGALLAFLFGEDSANVLMLYSVAAASAGFLTFNWAPARIFMGDVGSGFLGIMIALLALWSSHEGVLSIWTWLILGSLFIADATMTLFIRVLRRERWYSAHRSHAYQRLSRRWDSHERVTLLYIAVNVLLVWPLAYLSVAMPELAWMVALILNLLLSLTAWKLGAGTASG